MPLRVGPRADRPGLWITGTVKPAGAAIGIRIRQRAGSGVKALAREEAAAIEARILRDHHHGPRGTAHSFGAAALSYLRHAERSDGTKAALERLLPHLKAMPLDSVTQEKLDELRDKLLRKGAKPATARRAILTPVQAVLQHAARRRWCAPPMFDAPPEPKGRTAFLLPAQAAALIEGAGHLRPLVVFLLGTGCRAGESLALQWEDVDLLAPRVILHEGETKSGRRRIVTLPPAVVAALASLPHRDGPVFRRSVGKVDGYTRPSGLRRSWRAAVDAAGLPRAITPHVLRHTWASWHYAVHRDLLRLKVDGGWATSTMVERYAHLMPAGQQDDIAAIWGGQDPNIFSVPRLTPKKLAKGG